jgi:uncharacterized repeat protein (TIGR02543 family)
MRRAAFIALLTALAVADLGQAALTDGLAAYYSFEADLLDQSGNGRDLTVASGTPEAGWIGGTVTRPVGGSVERTNLLAGAALNLVDEDNDVLKAPLGSGPTNAVSGTFDLGSNFTVSAWHYLAPLPTNASTRYFVFEAEDGFDVSWGISAGSTYVGYNAELAAASANLAPFAWHHVAHVFSSEGGGTYLSVYVNGLEVGNVGNLSTNMNFDRLVLGDARDAAGDREWDGLLDEVALWTRALSAQEVWELHTRGRAGLGVLTDPAVSNLVFVTLSADPPHAGRVTGSGLHAIGSNVAVTATAAAGYVFTNWTGDLAGQTTSLTQTIAASVAAVAHFVPDGSDTDADGLTAYEERTRWGTDPALVDTDGDQLADGDEVHLTHTDPLGSDTGQLHRVESTFGPEHAGGLAMGPVRIASVGGQHVLQLGFVGSTNLLQWTPLPVAAPDVTLPPVGDTLELALPAPSSNTAVYLLRSTPP